MRETAANPTILSTILLGGRHRCLWATPPGSNCRNSPMTSTRKTRWHIASCSEPNAGGCGNWRSPAGSTGLLRANARNAAICSILWSGDRRFRGVHDYVLAVALLFCAGLLNLTFLSMAQTLVQLQAPTQLRGRLIGLFNMSNNCAAGLQSA